MRQKDYCDLLHLLFLYFVVCGEDIWRLLVEKIALEAKGKVDLSFLTLMILQPGNGIFLIE